MPHTRPGTRVESGPHLPVKAHAVAVGKATWRIHFPWGSTDRAGGNVHAVKAFMESEISRRFKLGKWPC